MPEYVTVFEITNGVWRVYAQAAALVALGLLSAVVGIAGLLRSRRRFRAAWTAGRAALAFLAVIGVLWLLMLVPAFAVQIGRLRSMVRAYRSGDCAVAEGVVHVVRVQSREAADEPEIVDVGGTRLEIDQRAVGPAYSKTVAWGGALREGVRARVCHHQGRILSVQVAPPE